MRKLTQIILFHDFAEITYGDVPYPFKTVADEARERAAAEGIFASLPASIYTLARTSWQAYEDKDSPEALFANALDKIEPLFELFDPVTEKTPMRVKQTYESHLGKKLRATETFPVMKKFVQVVSEDMLKRGIFWKQQ